MATGMAISTKTATATPSCQSLCRSSSTANAKPSWLLAALAELEEKYQSLVVNNPREEDEPVSFADRAENYYRKRPQLLSLLNDLYHRYLSLADRYTQTLLKPQKLHRRSLSQISIVHSDIDDADAADPDSDPIDSDAESSLSFQCPPPPPAPPELLPPSHAVDGLVAELVARSVEAEILQHEMVLLDKYESESSRKIELQQSLLEVLESERMVLLSENARLGTRAAAMAEDNDGLVAEVGYMRRAAEELARCVMKLREDHRVCLLGRKIQELQAQIYGLEKRNRECYEVMARREEEKAELVRGVCLELEKVKAENKRLREEATEAARRRSGRAGKWWGRVRSLHWALCGSHVKLSHVKLGM
uniref:Moesin/ezrin/radixin 1 n=1 Tax=Anthurium amnicola TaxID=1678845 RepID=A0A1D1Y2I3_9ARAE